MKKLLFIALVMFSCTDDAPNPNQLICVSGVKPGQTERVIIGCTTMNNYVSYTYYTVQYVDFDWKPVDTCSECK